MPKFSAYNLDRNTLKVYIEPTMENAPANIIFDKDYPMSFIKYAPINLLVYRGGNFVYANMSD